MESVSELITKASAAQAEFEKSATQESADAIVKAAYSSHKPACSGKKMARRKLLIIDGQGGKIGSQLISLIRSRMEPDLFLITAVGTNNTATAAMLKAGADQAATGENSVVVACREADVIIGPLGIVIADSLIGEVTATMAAAVGRSPAVKILIPVNKCNHIVAGVPELGTTFLLEDVITKLKNLCM